MCGKLFVTLTSKSRSREYVRQKLSLEEHQSLGKELHELRNQLQKRHIEVSNKYGVSHKVTRRLGKSLDCIDAARTEFENVLAEEYPELDNKVLLNTYYGTAGLESTRS